MAKTADRRQAVLGAATGYTLDALLPFVISLKKTGYRGRVCLFVWDLEARVLQVLERLGVELYPCSSGRTDKPYTVTGGRFFVFRQFLLGQQADAIEQVMLSDVRDVVFQRDPFAGLSGPGVHFFLERAGHTLGREAFNAGAMRKAYGEEILAALAQRPISCVGTTLGDTASMLAYLAALTKELAAMPEDFFGSDQAAHNRIVHGAATGFPRHVHGNDTAHVLHLGLVPGEALRLGPQGEVVNEHGEIVAVLHQYDRHPWLMERLLARLV